MVRMAKGGFRARLMIRDESVWSRFRFRSACDAMWSGSCRICRATCL